MPQMAFMFKEITVKGSFAYTHEDFRGVVAAFNEGTKIFGVKSILIAADELAFSLLGKFSGVSQMVTSRIALEDVVEKGFEELVSNKDRHIKILVMPRHANLTHKSEVAHA
jgi:threonine dehydrogenase-like Zn-dependent dehydrogenase